MPGKHNKIAPDRTETGFHVTKISSRNRLATTLGPLLLDNPVMPASGCFGPELAPVIQTDRLGAVVTKTVFSGVRVGNPAPRIAETPAGMLNSVGIPCPGIDRFLEAILPRYQSLGPPVVVSIGGLSVEDYWNVTDSLAGSGAQALEINVSCPNLERGGLEIGADPRLVELVTAGVRRRAGSCAVITKLTPNTDSIPELARAAEAGGADAVTVCNTLIGTALDSFSRKPLLGNVTGGLSGPAVKPLILRLVEQVARAVAIPVIGCGGIAAAYDAAEYLIAGATAVQVGTATFARPSSMTEIIDGFPAVLDRLHASDAAHLTRTMARA
jgi:dihydroorotate dehydrogenase (NAD+) catalytic subunit